jgi:Predicted membrane protein (DUF2127)
VLRPKALTLIITYKFARAIGSFLAALVGAVLVLAGLSLPLENWAQELHDNAVSEVALDLTSFVLTAVEPRHLWEVIGAIGLDALVLTLEGWALLRGWRWGVWLVVVASAVGKPAVLRVVRGDDHRREARDGAQQCLHQPAQKCLPERNTVHRYFFSRRPRRVNRPIVRWGEERVG